MAQADEALLRVCRLCVSIKMHTQGMSVDEATKFFQENCYYEEKPARSEAMRGTFDPGYLNYTLGKLQILKLRDDYKAQEGENYSLQKFNDEITNHGMPPIRMLREADAEGQRRSGGKCSSGKLKSQREFERLKSYKGKKRNSPAPTLHPFNFLISLIA